jgi:hypothetical protein
MANEASDNHASLPLRWRDTLKRLTRTLRSLRPAAVGARWPDRIQRAMPTLTRAECKALADYADVSGTLARMTETQMSFNLQYLQLQSQMQAENRSFTAVSNIMKTKHDMVARSIDNIR